MDRREIARGVEAAMGLHRVLLADAERELTEQREENERVMVLLLNRASEIARRDAELADYEKTVATLREQLREEQTRRASYQAVDAAARRFIAVVERLEETTSRPIDTPVNYEIAKLATAVRYA